MKRKRGSASLELALLFPVILLLLAGTMDFAQVFCLAQEVSSAAAAGARYGVTSTAAAQDMAAIQTAALNDTDMTGITASAARVCRCAPDGTSVSCSASCATGTRVTYIEVSTQATHNLTIWTPGLPTSIVLNGKASMRAPE